MCSLSQKISHALIQLSKQEDFDFSTGLFLIAVQTSRKHPCIVHHEHVASAEIFEEVFEDLMLNLAGIPMQVQTYQLF